MRIVAVLGLFVARLAAGAGPWQAQLIDAELRQPVPGVVVVAAWWKGTASIGGWSRTYHDSIETVTDGDGRFRIPAHAFRTAGPTTRFFGPEFLFFKGGYGRPVWPGYSGLSRADQKRLDTFDALLQERGIVLEMPRLATHELRRGWVSRVRVEFTTVPLERTPLLRQALLDERRALGLVH